MRSRRRADPAPIRSAGALAGRPPAGTARLAAAALALAALACASLFVGVGSVTLSGILSPETGSDEWELLLISRVPRTLAIVFAGASMAVAGMIMQMLARNRFVEPSTAGTADAAGLGMLVVILLAPDLPVFARMLVAAVFAVLGTLLFLAILRQAPLRSPLMVPLVGLMLGGVIGAFSSFLAYRYDLLQSLSAWRTGDFSAVLLGRYELLWLCFGLTLAAYVAADRFTVAGMGRDFTTNLGLDHRRVMATGLTIVALVTALVITTVGMIPFLGLVVPNVVSLAIGDNTRRALPYVALLGAGLVLACDVAGRMVRHPYEIPIGTVLGVVGSGFFLYLLLRKRARAA